MATDEHSRLGWLGLRLGFVSGLAGGAVSGFLALLLWGLTTIIFKIVAGEALGASDPATPREALLNAVFNAVFLGVLLGSMVGAAGGAVMGPFVPGRDAKNLRLGVWVGIVFVAPLSLVFVQAGWVAEVLSMLEGGTAGAIGGHVADRVFGRLYRRHE